MKSRCKEFIKADHRDSFSNFRYLDRGAEFGSEVLFERKFVRQAFWRRRPSKNAVARSLTEGGVGGSAAGSVPGGDGSTKVHCLAAARPGMANAISTVRIQEALAGAH